MPRTDDLRILRPTPALDGIRGLAIAAVLVNHWIFITNGRREGPLPGGFLGVDLFLVLSGFLITATLLRERDRTGTIDLRRFAERRLRRLVPAMIPFFAVHAAVALFVGDPVRNEAVQAALTLGFVGNWQHTFGHRPPIDLVHLWSVALEGQMYLLWGATVWAARRRLDDPRRLVAVVVASCVAIACWRTALFIADADLDAIYVRTDTRADSVLIGAIGALLWRGRLVPTAWTRTGGVVALALSAVCWVTVVRDSAFTFSVGFTLVAVLGLVIPWGALETGSPTAAVLGWRPLVECGRISYSLYLWHLPMFVWSTRAFPDAPDLALFGVATAASLAVATLSHRLVEVRFIRS